MKTSMIISTAAMAALTTLAAALAPLDGQATFDLSWNTIDGGGGTSTGGPFSVSGTIGQHDPGTMSGGSFVLSGGFWAAASVPAAPCPQDVTGDNNVGPADLAELLANWGPCPGCPADLTGDNVVGPADLAQLLAGWGPCR